MVDAKAACNMQRQIVSRGSVCPGSSDPGNKMDATNLATIFAPNLLHTLPEDVAEMAAAATSPTSPHGGGAKGGAAFLSSNTSSFSAMATGSPERMEYVTAVRYVVQLQIQFNFQILFTSESRFFPRSEP